MTPFVLPLTVRTAGGDVDLVVDLPGPISWNQIVPAILDRSGLPAGTVLYLGVGTVEGSWLLGVAPLLAGAIVSTEPQNEATTTGSVNLSCVAGPDAGGWVGIGDGPVTVGRHPGCDLSIDDPELSRWHARVEPGPDGLRVDDLRSVNGISVDGVPRPGAGFQRPAPAGGLLRMGGSVLRAGLDLEPALLVTPDGAGRVSVARPARVVPAFHFAMPPTVGPAPMRSRRPLPLMAAAIGGVAGAAVAIVTGLWTFLLLAALGPVMMLTTALSDRLGGRRSHRRELTDHRAALVHQDQVREAAVAADRLDAWDRYPDPATLARRARSGSSRLWERRPEHPDFLRLCLGIGQRPARVAPHPAPAVPEVPITVGLRQIGVLGLAGDCRPLLRNWLGQLVALHSPADLHLSIFSDHPDLARLRDLPHTAVQGRPGRLQNERADAEVARLLVAGQGPTTVVILDDADRWRRTARMKELLELAATDTAAGDGLREHGSGPEPAVSRASRPDRPQVVAICVAASPQALPVECTAVALVSSSLVEFAAGTVTGRAEATGVSAAYLEALVSSLAPLLDPDAIEAGLPPDVTLAQVVGSRDFATVMDATWARPGMAAVVGVGASGPMTIDLERDGPHLLIAGTTGSGKSELLRTLIAGLVLAAPPQRTAFLLIDYKGGAAFGHLGDLPHTVGVVTDLDAALAVRALSGLLAEVRRREQLLSDHRVGDLAALRTDVEAGANAPPSLVIVVDEFATLGAELPQFLTGLLDVAQRGRSLGLHLVLATQRPAGVLSPAMKANIGLRIALRVTDDADSVDVIDTPEAARLGVGLVGRALVRSERSRTTMFQVARVSTTAVTEPIVRLRDPIELVAPQSVPAGPTDLELIVDAARARTAAPQGERGTPATQRARWTPWTPWMPPLPEVYLPPDPDLVGLLDEPGRQRQVELSVPAGSIMLLGPPGSGRSCGLRRLAWCAAHRGAGLLVVDPSGSLADLARWPSTRTYLSGDDPVLVRRLVERLHATLLLPAATGARLLMIVDGWESISNALETLDFGSTTADLADLAARGAGTGLQVAVSGDLRTQHHRSAGAFTGIVRFNADERGEVRRSVPGRGVLGSTEVQWAHAPQGITPPDVPVPDIGPVIRPLPSRIGLADAAGPAGTTRRSGKAAAVPIGVGGDDATAQFVDLGGPGGGFLVAGPRRSGVSTTLLALGIGAISAGITVVRAHIRPLPPLTGAQDIDVRPGTDELQQVLTEHEGAILLVVDDLDGGDGPDEHGRTGSVSGLLERFIAVAGPGQYLALGTRLDRALRARRGPVAEVAAMRCGVLLQADSADGALLDAVLPRRRGRMLPGRGHLIRPGLVTPLQVAEP